MAITAHAAIGAAGLSATLSMPGESHRHRAQQACMEAVDAAQDALIDGRRSPAGAALADRPGALDALRDRPSVLDRL